MGNSSTDEENNENNEPQHNAEEEFSHEYTMASDMKPGSLLCDALLLCSDSDGLTTMQIVEYCMKASKLSRPRARELVTRGLTEGMSSGFVSKRRHRIFLGSGMVDALARGVSDDGELAPGPTTASTTVRSPRRQIRRREIGQRRLRSHKNIHGQIRRQRYAGRRIR